MSNNNILCRESEPFYYDLVSDGKTDPIPVDILEHINRCEFCQGQIDEIKGSLASLKERDKLSGQNDILKLHFHYIDKLVTCGHVRPFLPTLLERSLKVNLPTPVTAHLDNCRQCQNDLSAIKSLNLSSKNLKRLNMLFSYDSCKNQITCSQAQLQLDNFIGLKFKEIDTETLKHLCSCLDCQNEIYQRRQQMIDSCPDPEPTEGHCKCENISIDDLFDYTYPFGLDPAKDQYENFREKTAKHIQDCNGCVLEIQKLHSSISNIVSQPDSGIITNYKIKTGKEESIDKLTDGIYCDYPIEIEVLSQQDTERISTYPDTPAYRERPYKKAIKLFARFAAAAVIILAVGILINNITPATAVNLEKVYAAINSVQNVHIITNSYLAEDEQLTQENMDKVLAKTFLSKEPRVMQEKWVSKSLGLYLTRTNDGIVLWDIDNSVRKQLQFSSDRPVVYNLTPDDTIAISLKIRGSMGLVPFEKPSSIPQDAEWQQITVPGTSANTEVFELSWVQNEHSGLGLSNKWRFFINKENRLPQKIEVYEKFHDDEEHYLTISKIIEYLDDEQFEEVIDDFQL